MRVTIERNPVKAGTFRVVLHTGARASFESFLKFAEDSSTVTRADALAVFDRAVKWVVTKAAEGREADLGPLGRSRLGMKGVFEERPREIEDSDVQLTINWVLPREMKAEVAKAGGDLARERVGSLPKRPELMQALARLDGAEPPPPLNRYVPGGLLRVVGCRLDYDVTRLDEGVFLVTADGSEARINTGLDVEPSRILFNMPADASGVYWLEVRRRHPKGTGTLMTGRLEEPLEPL